MCHYQESDFKKVIFVLSVPGEEEEKAGFPAAADTGLKLNAILKHLTRNLTSVFPYENKAKYSITNSYDKPIYPNNNPGNRSQPTKSQILSTGNIDRFKREVEGYEYIILCGKDAQLLEKHVTTGTCISVSHLGNKALRSIYPNSHPKMTQLTSGGERDKIRVKLCAQEIANKINNCPDKALQWTSR